MPEEAPRWGSYWAAACIRHSLHELRAIPLTLQRVEGEICRPGNDDRESHAVESGSL